jgi:hypothetical protein
MVNRPISYFYNNFFRSIKQFCVIGQQRRGRLPEIRATRPRLRPKNRAFPPQSELRPRDRETSAARRRHPLNIFSLWLSYNNVAWLTSKSYPAIVMFAPGQSTGSPTSAASTNANSSFSVNRLQCGSTSLQRRKRRAAGVALRYARFARRHQQQKTRADERARARDRPSFFHIKRNGTARIAQPEFAVSLLSAA